MRWLSLSLLLLSVPTANALAVPSLRYTWGPASSLVPEQTYAGPGDYTQTLSMVGVSGLVSSVSVNIMHGRAVPAWDALYVPVRTTNPAIAALPQPDCLGAPGASATSTVAGAASIPGANLGVIVKTFAPVAGGFAKGTIEVSVTIDPPLPAEVATRYAIATLEYHHQNSVAGVSGTKCGYVDNAHCFSIVTASATVGGVKVNLTPETILLGWQIDPVSFPVECAAEAATPARPSTWGAIKTIYR